MTADFRRSGGGLGRGLAALIPQRDDSSSAVEIPISSIAHNPYQPRHAVEQAQLEDLAASIADHGVLQPILVTQTTTGYRLIAGERRVRAAEIVGLERIPALVRTATDSDQLAWALIENLQRTDLNAMEQARAFRQLVDEFGLSHEDVGIRVGRARSTVANTLRLLEQPAEIQDAVERGHISEGHARALAGIEDPEAQVSALRVVVARSLSVRQAEDLARRSRPRDPGGGRQPSRPDEDIERLERGLREALATKVSVTARRRGAGRITIEYYDEEELERLYERLTGERP